MMTPFTPIDVLLMKGFALLAGTGLCVISSSVPEKSVVPAGVVGCPRFVLFAASVISGLRAVPAKRRPSARALLYALVAQMCCQAAKGEILAVGVQCSDVGNSVHDVRR